MLIQDALAKQCLLCWDEAESACETCRAPLCAAHRNNCECGGEGSPESDG
jgi:hypothetical protein